MTDEEKWPIKTQKCQVTTKRLCASYGNRANSESISLLRHQERGEQRYPQRDEAPQGGQELIRPPLNTYSQTCVALKKKSLPEGQSQTFQSLVRSVYSKDEHPSRVIFSLFSVSRWLMRGSGQPSCVTDSKVIHDLAAEATPSVLQGFVHAGTHTHTRMRVGQRERDRHRAFVQLKWQVTTRFVRTSVVVNTRAVQPWHCSITAAQRCSKNNSQRELEEA